MPTLPSFGNLGTGRPGIPSFTPGRVATIATQLPPFWEPWYRQAGDSLFYIGTCDDPRHTTPTLLGTLVQAGRGFPLLLLPEKDLQTPAPSHSCTAPLPM